MSRSGFFDKTLLLHQGCRYKLKVEKILPIEDGGLYFLVRDINGLKHLINSEYYDDYSISPGQVIWCRLDRINCQGRFFFEPDHPLYRTGRSYHFRVIQLKPETVKKNGEYRKAIVADIFDRIWETAVFMPHPSADLGITMVRCKVTRIKKARLFLEVTDPFVVQEFWQSL